MKNAHVDYYAPVNEAMEQISPSADETGSYTALSTPTHTGFAFESHFRHESNVAEKTPLSQHTQACGRATSAHAALLPVPLVGINDMAT